MLSAFQSDPRFSYMRGGQVYDDSSQAVKNEAAREVLRLSQQVNVSELEHWQGRVEVMRSPEGEGERAHGSASKGYIHSLSPPPLIVQTETQTAASGADPVYRPIGDAWYIIYWPGE